MAQIRLLYRLQQIDSEIREKKQRLGEVLRAQKETTELQAARQRATDAAANVENWQTRRTRLDIEMEGVVTKGKRSEESLYSGLVKNPKELSDLQREIDALGRRRDALDNELLTVVAKLEEAETEKTVADKLLATMEARRQNTVLTLQQEQHELALRLHKLTGERQQQAALLDAESLTKYETMTQRKGGVAIAGLKGNQCQACYVTVSANKVKDAEQGKLVYCGGCDRILCPL
jgi:uncharacterized protein